MPSPKSSDDASDIIGNGDPSRYAEGLSQVGKECKVYRTVTPTSQPFDGWN